jgi:hypothetical protein
MLHLVLLLTMFQASIFPVSTASSSSKSPASVTHLTPAEQAKLDQVRNAAGVSEVFGPVQEEIDAIVKNHPGYHWESHGILSDRSGLMPDTPAKPVTPPKAK